MAVRGSVLLYNFTDKERADKVKFIFVLMGIKIRSVRKEDYLQPVGAMSGIADISRTDAVYDGEGFDGEMLVICGLTDPQMDQMLAYFRREGIRIPLKAALTPTNMHWNSLELHDELVREHEAVRRQMEEKKEKEQE
ncbi:DUF3783 domain-containing protein [Mordavella massiliensis]|uniref:DUF3783 domain-containing protein n=1 Tax=Mordavella massiliensis TaxID=1871024 RepID=A0A938X901_9CLOT|nr:DUF3783 domain-containing protein [Mordavella massiliensis]MBM6947103.1 DUF3783 domain-containing protein [Mordavella massiliensis]